MSRQGADDHDEGAFCNIFGHFLMANLPEGQPSKLLFNYTDTSSWSRCSCNAMFSGRDDNAAAAAAVVVVVVIVAVEVLVAVLVG